MWWFHERHGVVGAALSLSSSRPHMRCHDVLNGTPRGGICYSELVQSSPTKGSVYVIGVATYVT